MSVELDRYQEVRFYDQDGYFRGEVTEVDLRSDYPFVAVDFDNWIEKFAPNDLHRSCSSFIDMRTKRFEDFWLVVRRGVVTESFLDQQC